MSPSGGPGALFEWRIVDDGDDAWRQIASFDAYGAVAIIAELHDREERAIIRTGRSPVFELRLVEDRRTEVERRYAPIAASSFWSVQGEAVPTYYPHQVDGPNAERSPGGNAA